ncbi:hypothetical protein [Rhodanobacter lindaniclasticus]
MIVDRVLDRAFARVARDRRSRSPRDSPAVADSAVGSEPRSVRGSSSIAVILVSRRLHPGRVPFMPLPRACPSHQRRITPLLAAMTARRRHASDVNRRDIRNMACFTLFGACFSKSRISRMDV